MIDDEIRVFETREMKAYGAGPRLKDLRVTMEALTAAGVPEDAKLSVDVGAQAVEVTARWAVELDDAGEALTPGPSPAAAGEGCGVAGCDGQTCGDVPAVAS